MQYKHIVFVLLIALATSPLRAQQVNAVKHDTVITVTGKQAQKPANPVLATNINDDKKGGYRHVPLAGEKAYFGEKNEYVNDYVRKYLELHNKTLGSVQNNSITPFSVIDDVLEKKNLPKELKYLAVIESALNHNAVSHAGAVGTWQLMSSTARMLGLSVSRRSDERRDLYKSTTAATQYLEILYSQLNDWLLVIAAYNSGPIPVQRAIERTGSHNFWEETIGHTGILTYMDTHQISGLTRLLSTYYNAATGTKLTTGKVQNTYLLPHTNMLNQCACTA